MNEALRTLVQEYTQALQDYVTHGDDAHLNRVDELGRRAVAEGHGTLELAGVHHEAAISVLFRPFADSGTPQWSGVRMFCTTCPAWYTAADQSVRAVEAVGSYFRSLEPASRTAGVALTEASIALRHASEMLEQEAKRIANALHDEAGQLLTVVHLKLAEAARELPSGCSSCFGEISALLDRIESELRHLSHEVRPVLLDEVGLLPAVELLANGVSRRTGMSVIVDGELDERLPPQVETTLYRAIQESLTNVSRHADARCVRIILRANSQVHCAIRDDGSGFNVPEILGRNGERGLGLAAMRERVELLGGTLLIVSGAGQGTEVLITLPR